LSKRLETIDLRSIHLAGFDLREATSIRSITLINCKFDNEIFLPSSLTTLLLSGIGLTEVASQNLPLLERLEIRSCKKPQELVGKLLNEPSISSVNHDIDYTPADDLGWRNLSTANTETKVDQYLGFSKLKTFKTESREWLAATFHNIMRREDDLEETLSHPRLSELENLVLKGGGVDDNILESLIPKRDFPTSLQQVAFDSTKITGVTVKLLVESQRDLNTIWLVSCEGVGNDAVEWARGKGVEIQVRR
jgi:hypothetical protein